MITPAMELAEKILDQIDTHPETHNQRTFGEKIECGTVHCIAGWAVVLSNSDCYIWSNNGYMLDINYDYNSDEGITGIPLAAAELLGLNDYDSRELFFRTMDRNKAKEALKYIAKGETIPWYVIKPNLIQDGEVGAEW